MEAVGAILRHLGEKLSYLGRYWRQVGTLWQHVGRKMAKKSEEIRTWSELGWLKATRCVSGGFAGSKIARTGGCLELDFRDLERS